MKRPPYRICIAVMIFFTTFTNYMLRANISVSIVKMVDRETTEFVADCKENPSTYRNTSNEKKESTYMWGENDVGFILAAYFYGYILTIIPGGILSEMVGPWHVILWSSALAGVVTALTPLSAAAGFTGIFAARFATGLLGGFVYPGVNVLIAQWSPPEEKDRFLAAMMGNTLGVAFTFNIVGFVTGCLNWQWGFYASAIVMGIFCLVFALLVADNPQKCRWVKQEERQFISDSHGAHLRAKKIPPFYEIFKSCPFWALCFAQLGNLWLLNLNLTFMPKFMVEIMGVELANATLLASLPSLARLLFAIIFGVLGDYIRTHHLTTLTKIRKFFTIFSHVIPAAFYLFVPLVRCSLEGVVTLVVLNLAFNGAVVASNLVNPQDLSPNFAGTTYGLMNFFGSLTGIIVPSVSGVLLEKYNMDFYAAMVIFVNAGAILFVCGVIFLLCGTAEVQPWDEIVELDVED